MAKITYPNKATGDPFYATEANEVKTVVNANDDALALKAPIANPTFTGTVGGVTKSMVGLGNVDNTADADKPVSTATQQAINNAVVGLYDDRGNYDASVNTFPASGGSGTAGAILKGDIWMISIAGTLGGTAVVQGDSVRALVDSPGQTAGNWAVGTHGTTLTYASQAEAEAGTENTKVMTALRVFQNWLSNALTYSISQLNTTSKNIVGAINELLGLIAPLTPRTDVNFNPATGVQLDRSGGTWYNLYVQSGALELIIEAGSIVSGGAVLPITVDGNTVTITGAVIDPKSDIPDTTSGHKDRYTLWKDEMGIWYSITNLGA